jgi:hypothetical protein
MDTWSSRRVLTDGHRRRTVSKLIHFSSSVILFTICQRTPVVSSHTCNVKQSNLVPVVSLNYDVLLLRPDPERAYLADPTKSKFEMDFQLPEHLVGKEVLLQVTIRYMGL